MRTSAVRYPKLRLIVAFLALQAVVFFVSSATVSAIENTAIPFGNVPTIITAPRPTDGTATTPNYQGRCTDGANNNWAVAQNSWISTSNGTNFRATSQTVPYSTSAATYPLNVVLEDTLCYDNGSQFQVIDTWHRVTSVTASGGATVTGIGTNQIFHVGYPTVANKDTHVAVNYLPINITLPAGLSPGTYTFNVTLNRVARINRFRNGVYQCVQSGGNRAGRSLADFVGCAESNSSLPFIITVQAPLTSSLAGVRIDDSGVSSTGSTSGYGGVCYSATQAANCGNGTLTNYPFSNDGVSVATGSTNVTSNPFASTSNITAGTRTVSVTVPPGSGWDVRGYSICQRGAACTSQWLTSLANVRTNHSFNPATGVASFPHAFAAGATYDMRWIFRPGVTCSASPSSVAQGDTVRFTAGGFATGTITWSGDVGNPVLGPPGNVVSFDTSYSSLGLHTVTISRGSSTSTCAVNVITAPVRPYLSVFGGDVQAGSGFGPGCSASNGSAKIQTYNLIGTPTAGAGTRMAAFALDTITGFASRQGAGTNANELSFANFPTSATTNATYGGGFGYTFCAAAYTAPATGTDPGAAMVLPSNGIFLRPGGMDIRGTLNKGDHTAVYVEGDVTISDNIIYSEASGGWLSLSEIPSFYLIVNNGNIYIRNTVTQLDGVFIAKGTGTKGVIYTCASGTAPYPITADAAGCGTTLTINGAFIARQVKFLRTNGNVGNGTAAEIFNYGPEIWAR